MSYLQTPENDPLYDAEREATGYVANYLKVFALSPAVLEAWNQLNAAVKADMDLRRYELATLAAARTLRSSYCGLAHGGILRDRFYDAAAVEAIATDPADAGLDPVDVEISGFAERVAADATAIGQADIDALRGHGLSDTEIFQVVLAAAARCFFSTALDAVGAEPDPQLSAGLEPGLRQALAFGRPVPDVRA
ncbi:MAG: hypothetical protein ABIS86_17950 [Streptosporangiaceae bacterium]